MSMLTSGDVAPPFALTDQHGNTVSLDAYKGRKVLVFFYPRADTPGCTTQACGLRDVADQVGTTAIIGISTDAPAKQLKWATKHGISYPLLADVEHTTAEAYGVWVEKTMYGKKSMGTLRSAFLIDEQRRIEQAWYKISPADTPLNLLAALGA
jgi:thioredoxin-dependent peroxiredoxin